jgi:hypothetical protein
MGRAFRLLLSASTCQSSFPGTASLPHRAGARKNGETKHWLSLLPAEHMPDMVTDIYPSKGLVQTTRFREQGIHGRSDTGMRSRDVMQRGRLD